MMKQSVFLTFLSIIISPLLFIPTTTNGEGICVIEAIRVSEVKGTVLLPNKIPIAGANVELHKKSDGNIVALTKTDENGRFKFEKMSKGQYDLVAKFPTLVSLHVPVRISPSASRKSKEMEIVIILNGLIGKPCGGGDAYGEMRVTERRPK